MAMMDAWLEGFLRGPIGKDFERLVPALGALGVAFGARYMPGARGAVSRPL